MEISLARSTPQDVYEVEFRTLEFQVFNVTFPLFKSTVTSIPAIKYEVLTEIACPRFLHLSPISGGWFNSHFSIGFASLLVKTPKASEFLASKTCGTHSRATRFCTRRGAEKLQTIKTKQIAEVTFFSWNSINSWIWDAWNRWCFVQVICLPLRYEGRTKYSMTLAAKIQMVVDLKVKSCCIFKRWL